MSDEPEQIPNPSPTPEHPITVTTKADFDVRKYIIIIAMVVIGLSAGVQILHAVQAGEEINWVIMEKILDKLIALLSPPTTP